MGALPDAEASLLFDPDPSGDEILEKRLLFGEFEDQRWLAGSVPRFGGCM